MMKAHPVDSYGSTILLRYLEGKASPAEIELVEEWLARGEDNRVALNRLQQAWALAARGSRPEFDHEELWGRIRHRIEGVTAEAPAGVPVAPASAAAAAAPSGEALPPYPRSSRKYTHTSWRWGRPIFGGLLAAAVVVALVYLPRHESAAATDQELAMTTYTTRPGEVGRLSFPDGTKVIMAGASTLRVPSNWDAAPREVYLDGQAYFEVAHDSANTFRVHTERAVAEDLGTAFTVIAYPSDSVHQVAVSEGIVAISGAQVETPVVLHANDVAHIPATGAVEAARNVSVDKYFGWVTGRLSFDQERLADAIRLIERHFGVEVQVTDPALRAKRFTGAIGSTTLYEDLSGVAILLDAEYERSGKRITLSPKRQ